MKVAAFGFAVGSVIAGTLLTGCNGSQPPISSPGTMPQTRAIATHAERGGSWMLPEAKGEDLLYVSGQRAKGSIVKVFSYPGGRAVGVLGGVEVPGGLCSDQRGNIFVVDVEAQEIEEYAHGATTPLAVLSDVGNYPVGCSVDPMTGNLAVAGSAGTANVAIYSNASGSPTLYTDSQVRSFTFCTFDNRGSLFIVGQRDDVFDDSGVVEELPKGGDRLSAISVDKKFNGLGSIQWNGKYLVIDNARGQKENEHGPSTIYQVKVSGAKGKVVNTIDLASGGANSLNPGYGVEYWVQGGIIIGPRSAKGDVGFWRYPAGGNPERILNVRDRQWGVTISAGTSE